MELTETLVTLSTLPLGGRLLVRSKKDWRTAVVCRVAEDIIVLSISSPKGRNYRLSRDAVSMISFDGGIPVLTSESGDTWRDNFSGFDHRW